METWEPTERKVEAISENGSCPKAKAKGENLLQEWDTFVCLAKECGRKKGIKDTAEVWMPASIPKEDE